MSSLWVSDKRIRKWILPRRSVDGDDDEDEGVHVMACGHFQKKYDRVQGMIQQISCMDELLSGVLVRTCQPVTLRIGMHVSVI